MTSFHGLIALKIVPSSSYLLGSPNWNTADILGMAVTAVSVLPNEIPAALE